MITPESIRFRETARDKVAAVQDYDPTLSPVVAEMLVARGYTEAEDIEAFFHPSPRSLHDPFLLKDMDKACFILREALSAGERILVQGDYDCDGICGTCLLYTSPSPRDGLLTRMPSSA